MEYPSEQALVNTFIGHLKIGSTPWMCLHVSTEFSYQRGRADIVVQDASGDIMAFEAKLRDWRRALHQAYRNTCFANRSYVLLPKPIAELAQQYSSEFNRRKVGICYLEEGRLHVLEEANTVTPLQSWLSARAIAEMNPIFTDDVSNH